MYFVMLTNPFSILQKVILKTSRLQKWCFPLALVVLLFYMGMIIAFIIYQLSKELSRVVIVDPKISLWRPIVSQCRRITRNNGRTEYMLEYIETTSSNITLDFNVNQVWYFLGV